MSTPVVKFAVIVMKWVCSDRELIDLGNTYNLWVIWSICKQVIDPSHETGTALNMIVWHLKEREADEEAGFC